MYKPTLYVNNPLECLSKSQGPYLSFFSLQVGPIQVSFPLQHLRYSPEFRKPSPGPDQRCTYYRCPNRSHKNSCLELSK